MGIRNGSEDSVMRVLATVIKVFGVVVQRGGHFFLTEEFFNPGIHGCLSQTHELLRKEEQR